MSPFPVCDDTCREVIMDPTNELLVCTISGHCFDMLLSPSEMEPDAVSINFFYPFFFLFGISQLLSIVFLAMKLLVIKLVPSARSFRLYQKR